MVDFLAFWIGSFVQKADLTKNTTKSILQCVQVLNSFKGHIEFQTPKKTINKIVYLYVSIKKSKNINNKTDKNGFFISYENSYIYYFFHVF